MLDEYVLNKVYKALGNRLSSKAEVMEFFQLLKAKDDAAREYRRQHSFNHSVPPNYHPYLIAFGTLMRMVGMKERDQPRKMQTANLDRIARFLNYSSYAALNAEAQAQLEYTYRHNGYSGISFKDTLYSCRLQRGEHLSFKYREGREVELKYCGDRKFYVVRSIISRMQPGEYYKIDFICPNQALNAINLSTGQPYQCGCQGGIYDLQRNNLPYAEEERENE